jgi:hypothetical protein
MTGYIIILFSSLLSFCLAITLAQIAINKGAREACKVFAGILFSIVVVAILTPPIKWGVTELIEQLSMSDKDTVVFGLISCAILLVIMSVAFFYKKVQPRIAISGTYLINLCVWIFIFAHIGLINKDVSETMVFFILANGVLAWAVVGLNQPVDYRQSWFYWPLTMWSIMTVLVCLSLTYLYNSGMITEKTVAANETSNQLSNARQEKMQNILLNQIEGLENEYKVSLESAVTIEDCTKADTILLNIRQKKEELEKIKRDTAMLKPVADAVSSATQITSSIKEVADRDGVIGGTVKAAWRVAFGNATATTQVAHPRDVGWQRIKVDRIGVYLMRVYNGDEFRYMSPKNFEVIEAKNGEQLCSHVHNKSKDGKDQRVFAFYDIPEGGVEVYIVSLDGSEFEVSFRVQQR